MVNIIEQRCNVIREWKTLANFPSACRVLFEYCSPVEEAEFLACEEGLHMAERWFHHLKGRTLQRSLIARPVFLDVLTSNALQRSMMINQQF
jgi:hypothetical protein